MPLSNAQINAIAALQETNSVTALARPVTLASLQAAMATKVDAIQGYAAQLDVVGIDDGSQAAVGCIGEVYQASQSLVPMVSANYVNMCTISLPAGDWDVNGTVVYDPGNTTNMTLAGCSISPNSAAYNPGVAAAASLGVAFTAGQSHTFVAPPQRVNINMQLPYYLVGNCMFASGTVTAFAYMWARRVR